MSGRLSEHPSFKVTIGCRSGAISPRLSASAGAGSSTHASMGGPSVPSETTSSKGKEKPRRDSDSDDNPALSAQCVTRSTAKLQGAGSSFSLPSAPSSVVSAPQGQVRLHLPGRAGSRVPSRPSGSRSFSVGPGTLNGSASASQSSLPTTNTKSLRSMYPAATWELVREAHDTNAKLQEKMIELKWIQVEAERDEANAKLRLLEKEHQSVRDEMQKRLEIERDRAENEKRRADEKLAGEHEMRCEQFILKVAATPGLDSQTFFIANREVRSRVLGVPIDSLDANLDVRGKQLIDPSASDPSSGHVLQHSPAAMALGAANHHTERHVVLSPALPGPNLMFSNPALPALLPSVISVRASEGKL